MQLTSILGCPLHAGSITGHGRSQDLTIEPQKDARTIFCTLHAKTQLEWGGDQLGNLDMSLGSSLRLYNPITSLYV